VGVKAECGQLNLAHVTRNKKIYIQKGDWRNEERSWFHKKVYAYLKERSVNCNEENKDGRARVTAYEEQVLHADWTEIRSCR